MPSSQNIGPRLDLDWLQQTVWKETSKDVIGISSITPEDNPTSAALAAPSLQKQGHKKFFLGHRLRNQTYLSYHR